MYNFLWFLKHYEPKQLQKLLVLYQSKTGPRIMRESKASGPVHPLKSVKTLSSLDIELNKKIWYNLTPTVFCTPLTSNFHFYPVEEAVSAK